MNFKVSKTVRNILPASSKFSVLKIVNELVSRSLSTKTFLPYDSVMYVAKIADVILKLW